jgi:hypothetical protein
LNLFELFVKIGVDDQASGKLSKLSSGLGKGLATAAKIGTAAVGAAAAGITALTKAAVDNYAEYEQLVGGVQTLFGLQGQSLEEYAATVGKTTDEALDEWLKYTTGERKILNNAEIAFRTAGLSMNEYMETVTSFSASLIQSLDGDTAKAADYADQAIRDMSDNANKMGTDMSMIQNAYQGFAKQNYTMLDNLKLGYGGTAQEMYRLLQRAAELDETFAETAEFSIDSKGHLEAEFADITQAIHIVQTEMGITGTTALEAGRTISGSVGSMKAAWTNLVTGFANGNADIELLIEDLVTTIVGDGTENNLGVIGNVLPAIETALGGIAKLIEGAAPKIIEILPRLVERIVPSLISAATGLVNSLITVFPSLLQTVVDALIQNAPALIVAAVALVEQLATGVLNMLPDILQLGIDLIFVLLDGITKMIDDPAFIQTIVDVVLKMVDILTNPDTITKLLDAALAIMIALGEGIIIALPQLLKKIPEIIKNLVDGFKSSKIYDIGKNIVEGIKSGISNAWNNLVKWFKGLFGNLIDIAKKILGIASPSKVFKKIGGFTAEGFGAGFEDEFAHVKDDMEDALNFDDASVGINASIRKVGAGAAGGAFGGTSIGNVNITVNGAKYSDEQSLASAIALEIQNMTDRRAAVYA